MARNRETKIELTAYDDLFQTDESRAEAALSKIRDIPLSEIDEFPDHPFKVLMDEDMEQLVESVKRNGVMTPAITSRVHTKAKIPTHTLIKDFDGLDKNSIILFEQIRTIDKQRLREYLGTLDRRFIHCADKALAISIGLAKKD